MYRGSPTTAGSRRPDASPSAAMLADMNRLPSMPSRPAPHTLYSSYGSYQRPAVAPSQQDIVAPSLPAHRTHEPAAVQGHAAPQLPSLRTLLEPELLDSKLLEQSPALPRKPSHGASRFASSSPTLKRRHDFDCYSHERAENDPPSSRAPHVLRHASNASGTETHAFSTPGSTPGSRSSEFSRHGRSSLHSEPANRMYHRPPSTASASSDTVASHHSMPVGHDDLMDMSKPAVRRRTDVSSRAPVKTSRCLGQREIPGEGLCYVYEDGTYCRAVIDGEPVNPSWGITKAGKPRKRLAQACLTCREKKIKCEPGFPKCHQCAKSQRACRGGLNQLGMSNASEETPPSTSSAVYKNQSAELVSPGVGPDKSRPLDERRELGRTAEAWNAGSSPNKARRHFRPDSVTALRDMSVHSFGSDYSGNSLHDPEADDPRRGSLQDQLAVQWEQDPYETDPRLMARLLDLYFLHAGRATYVMFPRKPFTAWVENRQVKNQDDLMLLYSVLAMGSVFDPEHRAIGKHFAAIAAYATEKRFGKFSLQLCQSRLMLALYKFARGRSTEAWDFCGAALRAMSALKLNTEEGVKEFPDNSELDFGFDRTTLEECCRRTFWSGFLMDRYNGFCGGTLCVFNPEDTFLRLPVPEQLYENTNTCETPMFDFDLLVRSSPPGNTPYGSMAYLILISAIWGEVSTYTIRSTRRPDTGYEQHYESFYTRTYAQLDSWLAQLPLHLRNTPQNLDNAIVEGTAGTFVSLHALYYTTVIRLNRHVRVRALSRPSLCRNIDQTFRNASNFLTMMLSLSSSSRHQRLGLQIADFVFSTPFPGYTLMLSIDVLGSAGIVETLPDLIQTLGKTLTVVEELASFWASARAQQKSISARLKQLTDIAVQEEQGIRNGDYGNFWRVSESLDTGLSREDDAVYKVSDELLFGIVSEFAGR